MDQSIRQSMDLCRGPDDLSLEEMADLRQALQEDAQLKRDFEAICATDQLVRQALHEVEVPASLQTQILERLSDQRPAPASRPNKFNNVMIAISAAAVACVLALAVFPYIWGSDDVHELTVDGLQTAAKDSWLRSLQQTPTDQWTDTQDALPTPVILQNPVRRMRLSVKLGPSKVLRADVFQLPMTPSQAYLVAVKLPANVTVSGVSKGPPRKPFLTGGWAIGVWQEGNTLYVIMVKGTLDDYSARLKRPELT